MSSVASVFAHGGQDYMKWQSAIKFSGGSGYELVAQTTSMDWNCIATPSPITYYLSPNGAFGCDLYTVQPRRSTVFEGAYHLTIDVRNGVVRTLDSTWSARADAVHGLYDPPVAPSPISPGQGASWPSSKTTTSASKETDALGRAGFSKSGSTTATQTAFSASISTPASPSSLHEAPTPLATSVPTASPDSTTKSSSMGATLSTDKPVQSGHSSGNDPSEEVSATFGPSRSTQSCKFTHDPPNAVLVDKTVTVTASGSPATVNGHEISAVAGGIVIGASTASLEPSGSGRITGFSVDWTIGGHTYTAVQDPSANNDVILDGTVTLKPGSTAPPFEAQTFRLQPNVLEIDGSSTAALASTSEPNIVPALIAADHGTFTAVWGISESKDVIVDGTATLTAGSAARTTAGKYLQRRFPNVDR